MEEIEIVISGVGGKFPDADQIDELKEKLMNKENLASVDDRRWQIGQDGTPPAMGKVRNVEKFDTTFFGCHRRLSNFMDPQNRHILERSYEAIYDAGYNPNNLKGANIGVFISAGINETEYILISQKIRDGFGILGLSRAMLPNRISYFFNFKGSSSYIQTGWEGGLEILTMASNHIKEGLIDAALVGVPNLHLFSKVVLHSVTMGLLTFDENTKSFDADADGYVQSEAVVMLFLQRKEDAKRVYATVVHSASCVFGARLKFMSHDEEPIVSFLEEFYQQCKVDPKTVGFVEADGSAIKEMDEVELKAISKVFGKDKEDGLLVGSVKSNLGHTEAASGFVGLVKAIIALDSGIIPSNINYNKPHLPMPSKVKIVSEHTQLKGDLIAVNAMSFTGGVGHALLRQNPKEKQNSSEDKVDNLPRLLLVSARNIVGAENVINKVSSMPLNNEFVSLINGIHLTDIPGHMYRTYVVHQGDAGNHTAEFAEVPSKKPPVWFIFSGMGSQWPSMGRDLLKIKIFADSIAKCDKILARKGLNIYNILTDSNPEIFDDILNCFVGIACIQVALVDLLCALGIKPDGIVGHSVGEVGCAYADGCFTAEETILVSYYRGIASKEAQLIVGAMAAIGTGYQYIKDKLPPGIEVACHNSSESCTISGPQKDVKIFVDKLTEEGIFARMVKSADIAYHSKYIQQMGPKLLSYLKEVIREPKHRSSKWISSSLPYSKWKTPLAQFSSPEYHTNNLLSHVLFEEACQYIPSNALCIEIAPHGLLQAIVKRSLKSCIHIPLTSRNAPCQVTFMLSAVGKMYLNNSHPNVNILFPKVEYPVPRGTPCLASLLSWDHSENWSYGERNRTVYTSNEEKITLDLQNKKYKEICSYKVNNNITVPTFMLLFFVWKKLLKVTGKKMLETPILFEDIWVHEVLTVPQFSSATLLLLVNKESGHFEITVNNKDTVKATPLISGRCSILPDDFVDSYKGFLDKDFQFDHTNLQISQSDLYDIFHMHGYSFTGGFQNIKGLFIGERDIVGKIEWNGSWLAFFEGLVQVSLYSQLRYLSGQTFLVPMHIQRFQLNPEEFLHHSEKKEVDVYLNSDLNTIHCSGIKLVGLSLKPVPNNSTSSNFFVDSPIFVPHGKTQFKSVDKFLSACIQIAQNNKIESYSSIQCHSRSSHKVLLIEDAGEEFFYKDRFQNYVEIISSSSFKTNVNEKNNITLTASTENLLSQSVDTVEPVGGFVLIQSKSSFNVDRLQNFNNFTIILQQQFNTTYLILLKKKEDKYIHFIVGSELDKSNLLSQIQAAVKTNDCEKTNIAVIHNIASLMSVKSIIQQIATELYISQITFIFIAGSQPPVNQLSLLYENQLKKGLLVNCYKNDQWGSVIMVDSFENKTSEVISFPTNWDRPIEFKYIGLNADDFNYGSALKTNPSLGPLEFSGILKRTEKVMGLISWNPGKPKLQHDLDDEYLWRVPNSWSLEDAVTIPFSYSMAIYSLKLLLKLKPNESVLIHSGFSTLGQAAITIALQVGSTVYTTVNSEKQKQQIFRQFPMLNAERVLKLENNWFEDQILSLTSGKGVHVIFSTVAGESFNASLRCLTVSGRIIQLNRADMELGNKIGMSVFLNNTSLYAFNVEDLFIAPPEWKKVINETLKDAILSGVIKPLKRKVHKLQSNYGDAVQEILNSNGDSKVLLSVDHESNKILNKPIDNEHNKTFIIVGSGSGLWLDIIEILVKNGVYNLMMVLDSGYNITASDSHRMKKLMSMYDFIIETLSINQINTIENTEKLLQNILKCSTVDSIFITLMAKDKHYIHNLDSACRKLTPDIKFVCLIGTGEDICESRLNCGLHASAIKLPSPSVHPKSFVNLIEPVLTRSSDHKMFFLSQSTDLFNDNNLSLSLFNEYLPSTLCQLETLSSCVQDEFSFTEVNSMSPHLADLKNAIPVFILPGLNIDCLTPLIHKIMVPVFCAEFPSKIESAIDAAKHFLVPLLKIQPKGPYNIIGETWNGGIALELARLLEESGHTVLVILLNGCPHIFQNLAINIGPRDSLKFNKKVLSILLNLQYEVLDAILTFPEDGKQSWNVTISAFIQHKFSENDNSESKKKLKLSLDIMYSRILSMLCYHTPLLKSSIALVQSSDSLPLGCNLSELYGDNVTAYLMDASDHTKMISSVQTADLINDLVYFTF